MKERNDRDDRDRCLLACTSLFVIAVGAAMQVIISRYSALMFVQEMHLSWFYKIHILNFYHAHAQPHSSVHSVNISLV